MRSTLGRILSCLVLVLVTAEATWAAVIEVVPGSNNPAGVNLGTSQTGNTDTTNTMDRGQLRGPVLLKILSVVGSTPTVTVNVLGSMDGTNFYNIPYSLPATAETATNAAIVITSATTNYYILRPFHPWRFLKLNYSANTNVTLTADAHASVKAHR
jgi:hypothetical protein